MADIVSKAIPAFNLKIKDYERAKTSNMDIFCI
jgi:hypothetical protein